MRKQHDATELQPKSAEVATPVDQSVPHSSTNPTVMGRSEGGDHGGSPVEGERILSKGDTGGGRSSEEVRRPRAVVGRRNPGGTDDPGRRTFRSQHCSAAPSSHHSWLRHALAPTGRRPVAGPTRAATATRARSQAPNSVSEQPIRVSAWVSPFHRFEPFAQYSCNLMRDGHISVLVIEDEADIRQLLRTLLEREGFSVSEAIEGRDGVRQFHQAHPDIVILDVGLPDLDGWQVLERIRDMSDVPVLMLTALGTERDKVRGLNAGADDYLTKPFSRVELLARLQAISRRQVSRADPVTTFDDGTLHVDFAHQEVTVDGAAVVLTPTEYRLLATLARHQGQVLSSDQLIELAWDDPSGLAPSRVKYAVLRLRRKLGWDEGDDTPIETVRGFGYRYRSRSR
jgi:DNA-binding response OmpR family regulator